MPSPPADPKRAFFYTTPVLPGRLRYTVPFIRAWLDGLRGHKLPSSDGRQLIIVTGAGRSGTSAVARLLHESGLSMGGPFVETSEQNPVGFYEDKAIIDLHDALLTQLGLGDFLTAARWPWRTTVLAVASGYRDEMLRHVARGDAGWKDPRFSIMLESWLPLLPAPPKVIVCLRSPKSYADSVVQVYGFVHRRQAEEHWARQYKRLLDVIRDYRLEACCVEYDALIEQPAETVDIIGRFVGRSLDPGLLEPALRHHVSPVRLELLPLYEEVLALSPQLPRSRTSATDPAAYLTEVRLLIDKLLAARATWLAAVGTSEPRLDAAASSTYDAAAREAQDALQRLDALPQLEAHHDAVRALFDYERLTAAAFAIAATTGDPDRRRTALECWTKFSSPAQFDRRLGAIREPHLPR